LARIHCALPAKRWPQIGQEEVALSAGGAEEVAAGAGVAAVEFVAAELAAFAAAFAGVGGADSGFTDFFLRTPRGSGCVGRLTFAFVLGGRLAGVEWLVFGTE
jgi:hypothetical protein